MTRVYEPPPKRASISKKDAADALLSLNEREPVKRDAAEGLLSLSEMRPDDSQHKLSLDLKEKDAVVQTTITYEHLKTHPTELLTNTNNMQKCMFLENVANDSAHYTGKKNIISHDV